MVGFGDALQSATSQFQQFLTLGGKPSNRMATRMVRDCVPQMSFKRQKGSYGKICIIGGSFEYTGAPYFSAISAMKTGADWAPIVCHPTAAPVIKSYSPELTVYPSLEDGFFQSKIDTLLRHIDVAILGPGLGRDPSTGRLATIFLEKARERQLPVVIDADGLHFFSENLQLLQGYTRLILTPNETEFGQLYEKVIGKSLEQSDVEETTLHLAQKLDYVTIVRKGTQDVISDGRTVIQCDLLNSPRRCAGQGDLLTGAVATFLHWTYDRFSKQENTTLASDSYSAPVLAAFAACCLIRQCNKLAFQKCSRSTTTANMVGEIQAAFHSLFE
ncbi:ATP dependent (S) NAD(P)H hydrate dehydratase [Trichuris trichiura]|uniref:ATP-dependent (S)-NAD(P)H-hydrate dehydratase n=1 Tax=Trichuris trichiura TaxID=36087 RepID=A0A077Z337_TRITR|nr:ATP dependent (S) NAD(P)H hydrate dehydratase [Trichuris trichiura]